MKTTLLLWIMFAYVWPGDSKDDLTQLVDHAYAENDGIKIHYAGMGEGDLVLMIHGFPDYWYTWRHQMEVLASDFRAVAMDQRGYNLSDKPEGVEHYTMNHLVADALAVIADTGAHKATVVGHDWGAAVAWQIAMQAPEVVERLVIFSVPHPSGFSRELATNKEQQANSQYARDFQEQGAHKSLSAKGLAGWVPEEGARQKYVEAFERSDFAAMLNYYKANYPKTTSSAVNSPAPAWPKIQVPVLIIHGLKDTALHASGHNDTWNWVEKDLTLLMIPDAGHFVQHDATELVNQTLRDWLLR